MHKVFSKWLNFTFMYGLSCINLTCFFKATPNDGQLCFQFTDAVNFSVVFSS